MTNNQGRAGAPLHEIAVRETRTHLRSKLAEEVELILRLTSDRYIYPDTIDLLFECEVTASRRNMLRRLYGRSVYLRRSQCGLLRMRLHRPNLRLIEYIDQFLPQHIVSRVDFAADFIVHSLEDATKIGSIFVHRLSMPWRGKRTCKTYKETFYFSQQWKRRNIVVYSDRPSKITKQTTTHVEFRWFGAEVCRGIGIRTVYDVVDFNPIDTMCRQSRFSTFLWSSFEKAVDAIAGALTLKVGCVGPMPWHWDRRKARLRIQGLITRLVRGENDTYGFNQLKDYAPAQVLLDLAGSKNSFFRPFLSSTIHLPITPLFAGAKLIGPRQSYRVEGCAPGAA